MIHNNIHRKYIPSLIRRVIPPLLLTAVITPTANLYANEVDFWEDEQTSSYTTSQQTRTSSLKVFATTELGRYIAEQMLAHNEEIDLSDYNISSEDDLGEVVTEAYRQNPLIGSTKSIKHIVTNSKNVLQIEYIENKSQAKEYKDKTVSKVHEIIQSLNLADKTDLQKEAAISKYLNDNATYDEYIENYLKNHKDVPEAFLSKYNTAFIPYGVLVEGIGVCESYAEAFKLLAEGAGLETILDLGTNNEGIYHEWCKIRIGDKWYVIDPTANDNEYAPFMYFNLSDIDAKGYLNSDETTIVSKYKSNYKAIDSTKDFYKMVGRYAENNDEATTILVNLINQGITKIGIKTSYKLSEDDLSEIFSSATKQVGDSIKKYNVRYKDNFVTIYK